MADDEDEDEEGPVVELGEGSTVEGAPLARVSSRLHYGIKVSEVERREGDTTIRTPDGPRDLGDVLAETDETFFPTRQAFEAAVREVVGHGPVPTDDE
jgi:Trk K+ transport system NAD-binding subunit